MSSPGGVVAFSLKARCPTSIEAQQMIGQPQPEGNMSYDKKICIGDGLLEKLDRISFFKDVTLPG
jgi:hypothetical protein